MFAQLGNALAVFAGAIPIEKLGKSIWVGWVVLLKCRGERREKQSKNKTRFFFPPKPIATYQNGALIFFWRGRGLRLLTFFFASLLATKGHTKATQLAADVRFPSLCMRKMTNALFFFGFSDAGKRRKRPFPNPKVPFSVQFRLLWPELSTGVGSTFFLLFCEMVGRRARGGQKRREGGGSLRDFAKWVEGHKLSFLE